MRSALKAQSATRRTGDAAATRRNPWWVMTLPLNRQLGDGTESGLTSDTLAIKCQIAWLSRLRDVSLLNWRAISSKAGV